VFMALTGKRLVNGEEDVEDTQGMSAGSTTP